MSDYEWLPEEDIDEPLIPVDSFWDGAIPWTPPSPQEEDKKHVVDDLVPAASCYSKLLKYLMKYVRALRPKARSRLFTKFEIEVFMDALEERHDSRMHRRSQAELNADLKDALEARNGIRRSQLKEWAKQCARKRRFLDSEGNPLNQTSRAEIQSLNAN
jgi:hypothetical protein